MTHMDHMGFTVKSLTKYDTKRLAAKITLKNSHLITLYDEMSGTMLFKALRTSFCKKIRHKQVLCQLTVKPKANVSSQLNFRLFVSCQSSVNPILLSPHST